MSIADQQNWALLNRRLIAGQPGRDAALEDYKASEAIVIHHIEKIRRDIESGKLTQDLATYNAFLDYYEEGYSLAFGPNHAKMNRDKLVARANKNADFG